MAVKCSKCHTDLERNERLLKGYVVSHCRTCATYNVEGSPHWPTGSLDDPSMQKMLLRFADEVEEARNRHNEMMTADEDDPRWDVHEII